MPKPRIPNQRRANIEHKKRTERYVMLIKQVYDRLADEASRRAAMTGHNPEVPFSFADYTETAEAIKQLQAEFIGNVGSIIMAGTSNEWKESNLVQDLVAKKVLTAYTGTSKSGEEYTRYYETNPDALKAFQQRRDSGMKLSDRVWNLSEQYKAELEMAISAAIAPGVSAQRLSQDVRKFLNEPDLMFRRFRYKDDAGRWRKKWKRRITDEDGNVRFIDCDRDSYRNQWTGPGYYKSSFKNAMRLARTEINMAYRAAEQERWRQFDFVVGYEVKLTQNGKHVTDICDDLVGKYPKSFRFSGFHPHCLCYCIPILKTEDEFWEVGDAGSKNEVTDVPQGFKDWVRDNEERIERAAGRGRLPYFLRDNPNEVNKILHPEKVAEIPASSPLSIQERAAIRHANRTQEDIDAIQQRWNEKLLADFAAKSEHVGGYRDSEMRELAGLLQSEVDAKDFNAFKADYRLARDTLNGRIERDTALVREWLKDPDNAGNMRELAKALGVSQGDAMTFFEADQLRGNPNYGKDEIYRINCQTAVVANELRRRGFNVQALGNTKGSWLEKLSHATENIWIDANGKTPTKKIIGAEYNPYTYTLSDGSVHKKGWQKTVANRKQLIKKLEEAVTVDGRYHIDWVWNHGKTGHIITLEKVGDVLRYYDPQTGQVITDFYEYTSDFMLRRGIKLLRVDNLRIDADWASKILAKGGSKASSGAAASGGISGTTKPPHVEEYRRNGDRIFVSPMHGADELQGNLRLARKASRYFNDDFYLLPAIDPDTRVADELRRKYLPSGVPANKNTDFLGVDVLWEGKELQPDAPYQNREAFKKALERQFRNAKTQADNFIIDVPEYINDKWIEDITINYLNRTRTKRKILIFKGEQGTLYEN